MPRSCCDQGRRAQWQSHTTFAEEQKYPLISSDLVDDSTLSAAVRCDIEPDGCCWLDRCKYSEHLKLVLQCQNEQTGAAGPVSCVWVRLCVCFCGWMHLTVTFAFMRMIMWCVCVCAFCLPASAEAVPARLINPPQTALHFNRWQDQGGLTDWIKASQHNYKSLSDILSVSCVTLTIYSHHTDCITEQEP